MSVVISNVRKCFQKRVILDRVNLTIGDGEIHYLIGMNGSGKTTLIYSVLDLISIETGTVLFDGMPLSLKQEQVSVLFDECFFYNNLSVKYNIECLSGVPVIFDEFQTELFRCLQINKLFLTTKVRGLSLGQRNKLGFCIALIRKPKYLFLDEPFIGLDYIAMQLFVDLLHKEKSNGCCIFVTGQNYTQLATISDAICILDKGEITSTRSSNIEDMNKFVLDNVKRIARDGGYHGSTR